MGIRAKKCRKNRVAVPDEGCENEVGIIIPKNIECKYQYVVKT